MSVGRCDKVKKIFETSYQLIRLKASEFLGFMISDLDRMADGNGIGAVPVAYGLKGYSLPTDSLRGMLEHVLQECSQAGLYVPVCSFDGQWFRITVRDQNNIPLTLIQLMKDFYAEVKRRSVSQMLADICKRNLVQASSAETLTDMIKLEISSDGKADVYGKCEDDSIRVHGETVKRIKEWKNGKFAKNKQAENANCCEDSLQSISTLPVDVVDQIPDNILQKFMTSASTTNNDKGSSIDVDGVGEALETMELPGVDIIPDTNIETPEISNDIESRPNPEVTAPILYDADYHDMLNALRNRPKRSSTDWQGVSEIEFKLLFSNAKVINKSFTKDELSTALKAVMGKLSGQNIQINITKPKYQIVTNLSETLGDGSVLSAPKRRLKKALPSLTTLTKAVLSKLPKDILCSVCARCEFPVKLTNGYNRNPFGRKISIDGLCCEHDSWYSMPEFNQCTGNYLFLILDTYHQLYGLRRLVCQNGIPLKGIKKEAFVRVARESENNGSQLNLAMVVDMVDKQNVEFAKATFSPKVASALEGIGEHETTEFCRIIHNWYRAEDEPGISSIDRCRYRLELRKWLLDGISVVDFPPPGSHIQGIPAVLYEGLLTNIERKIQLYTFTKRGTYNVLSVGSLDIENFFGTFQDIDPRGTGVLRPDDIPLALSVASEILDAKLDPNR